MPDANILPDAIRAPDLAMIRAGLPALQSQIYLNSGTIGPLPAVVAQAMRDAVSEDEWRGRASGRRFAKIDALLADCRARLGALVGVSAQEVALASGTTEGLAIALDGLDWTPGERIVTSDLEHPDVIALLEAVKRRRGVDIVTVAIAPRDDDAAVADAFARALAPGAKLALFSHVAFGSGRVLPVGAIAAAAHAAGASVLVDGAQAVGAITVDVPALGADFYAFPGQKWLMGPEGSGALVIRHGQPAAAFERGTAPKAIWAGLQAALVWRAGLGSEAALTAHVARIRERLRAVLAATAHAQVVTPADGAGLIAFRFDSADGPCASLRLSARRIAAREIPGTGWLRLSSGIFVSDDDVAAVGAALAHGEVAA